jgi:hypothetical protein
MGSHINAAGRFQSDKYPQCPPGKVPLSTKDPMAQDLLYEYADRRRVVDEEFAEDVKTCLRNDGYIGSTGGPVELLEPIAQQLFKDLGLGPGTYVSFGHIRNALERAFNAGKTLIEKTEQKLAPAASKRCTCNVSGENDHLCEVHGGGR